jgi:ABC-type branched-subunit amino acid transport system substrate-binding protein
MSQRFASKVGNRPPREEPHAPVGFAHGCRPLHLVLSTWAGDAPAEIKRGTLYASSGPFASISMPVHDGLKLWIDQKNAEGGVYVKTLDHKIPIKLVVYDDQSSTPTAATLYNQLITQDRVDVLISDSRSVLTRWVFGSRASTRCCRSTKRAD